MRTFFSFLIKNETFYSLVTTLIEQLYSWALSCNIFSKELEKFSSLVKNQKKVTFSTKIRKKICSLLEMRKFFPFLLENEKKKLIFNQKWESCSLLLRALVWYHEFTWPLLEIRLGITLIQLLTGLNQLFPGFC